MRYLLLDRIRRVELNSRLIATKNVTLSEDVFVDHFVGFPVLPGALLIEAVAQAGTALLELSNNFKMKALLVLVDRAKFRELVQPGDQLLIEVNVLSLSPAAARMNGTIHVDERLVTSVLVSFVLKPASQFYPEKTRHLMEAVYDYWLKDAHIISSVEPVEQDYE